MKDQYWLFVGMCFIGVLIGGAVPLGILLGPMMCGLYLTFFKTRRGEPIEFGTMFQRIRLLWSKPDRNLTSRNSDPCDRGSCLLFFLHHNDCVGRSAGWQRSEPGGDVRHHGCFGLFWLLVMIVDHLHLHWIHVCLSTHRRPQTAGL